MNPPLSRKTGFRLARLHTRLMAQVEVLDAVPRDARRAPMPKPMRGASRHRPPGPYSIFQCCPE